MRGGCPSPSGVVVAQAEASAADRRAARLAVPLPPSLTLPHKGGGERACPRSCAKLIAGYSAATSSSTTMTGSIAFSFSTGRWQAITWPLPMSLFGSGFSQVPGM